MEQIKATVTNIRRDEPMRTLSENQRISTPIIQIDRDQHVALFQIINKARMLNGWQTKTALELDATIKTWGEVLNHYRVPTSAYNQLYFRAIESRQLAQRIGKEMPTMSAELLISCWTGQNGLQAELEQKRISDGRTLTGSAKSQCPKCFGTNLEYSFDENGNTLGIIGKCRHD